MTFAVAFGGVAVSGVLMHDSYHFSVGELGFVLGCMGLGVAISEIIWGILTDMLGDKVILFTGLTLMGAIFLIAGIEFAPTETQTPGYLSLGALLL
jgi:sugar phosphate permease